MRYVEMTIEEAMKRCNKNDKVLVAIKDLENDSDDGVFVRKIRGEYESIFDDVKTEPVVKGDSGQDIKDFDEDENNK